MGIQAIPQSEPNVKTQATSIHALEGFEIEPPAIDASIAQRLLYQLAKSNDYAAKMRHYNSGTFHGNLDKARKLAGDIYGNGTKQALAHGATAFFSVALGAAAAKNGIDVTSGVTVADKLGNGGVKALEANGTFMSSDKQMVDHQISKNSDANQRVSAFAKQFMELVRTYMDQQSQQNRPLGG